MTNRMVRKECWVICHQYLMMYNFMTGKVFTFDTEAEAEKFIKSKEFRLMIEGTHFQKVKKFKVLKAVTEYFQGYEKYARVMVMN